MIAGPKYGKRVRECFVCSLFCNVFCLRVGVGWVLIISKLLILTSGHIAIFFETSLELREIDEMSTPAHYSLQKYVKTYQNISKHVINMCLFVKLDI